MKKKRYYRFLTTMLCLVALLMGSVSQAPVTEAKSKKPSLSKKKLTIKKGKTKVLKVKNAKGAKITFKVNKKKIVKVTKKTKISFKIKGKKAGKAKLTVRVKKNGTTKKLSCKITVKKATVPVPTATPVADDQTIPTSVPTEVPSEIPTEVPTKAPTETPTETPTEVPTEAPTEVPTVAPTATPTVAPTVAPTETPTEVPTVAPTAEPVIPTGNALSGSTVKSQSNNTTGSVSGDTATVSFNGASKYSEAKFLFANPVPLATVTKVTYTLSVSGTPNTVSFKLYDDTGSEISGITKYNQASGTHSIEITSDLQSKTLGGFGIMTNSDITDPQTATVTLKSFVFEYVSSGDDSDDDSDDDSGNTDAPTIDNTNLTLSADTFLAEGATSGSPTYNSDGSVTFTATQNSSGGGMGFYINSSKTGVDLSGYSQVIFHVSASASIPITLTYFTSTDYWSGRKDISYPYADTTAKDIACDVPAGVSVYGFGVKYNTYGQDTSTLPTEPKITIHSITLVKDERDITDAVTNYDKLYELAADYGFKLGTVMNPSNAGNEKYAKLMAYHFNSITAANEMKAYGMLSESASKAAYKDETSMSVLNFTNADKIADYAKSNGKKIRGHVLVWDADMCDWFFRVGFDSSKEYASKEVIQTRLKDYIRQVITHFETKYPGLIYCWDVVNEAVGDNSSDYNTSDPRHVRTYRGGVENVFYTTLGSDYVELSFQYAYEVVQELKAKDSSVDIKLFYNDYNTFYPDKRDAICNLIESINSYLPDGNGGYVQLCDGMGMQSYIGGFGQQSGCMNDSDLTRIKTAIEKYASLGVEVQVTELAVRNYQDDAATITKHAEFYKKLFQVYLDVNSGTEKPLTAVAIWGIVDIPTLQTTDYSYRMNGPYCGLFDETLAVKESFKEVYELLK